MKRLDYEAPTMEEIVVEMENGFLGASVIPENERNATINSHQVNTDFTTAGDFSSGDWDADTE